MLAVIPFLTNNSFSNTVMAQGYDNNYDDNKFSKYPTKDKKVVCKLDDLKASLLNQLNFVN